MADAISEPVLKIRKMVEAVWKEVTWLSMPYYVG